MKRYGKFSLVFVLSASLVFGVSLFKSGIASSQDKEEKTFLSDLKKANKRSAEEMTAEGREIFRFDTFGDEAFWTDQLKIHQIFGGERFGGVGNGVSPRTALALGLKVDADVVPDDITRRIKNGTLDLDDPANTLELLRRNAVVGTRATFNEDGSVRTIGFTCALCHSTVDNSVAFGIGQRLDGWANRDLNVGAIIASAPDLSAVLDLLRIVAPGITAEETRSVLNAWGPGKFDAELFLDGKAFNPAQNTNGIVTAINVPGATLIPNAFDMAGFNIHTWTGWGNVTYWNAFVAVLELHGLGTFFDSRLNDAAKFPIAAAKGFGKIQVPSDQDQVTSKLPALHVYQLVLPSPSPQAAVHFDPVAASRGYQLFIGKANCNTCHVEPIWTEPGWNLHTPEELKIDAFQANRSPDNRYKTMNLSALFIRELGLFMAEENKGRFYHDGRFLTLADVVTSYNQRFSLNLTDQERSDLVEYLKSL